MEMCIIHKYWCCLKTDPQGKRSGNLNRLEFQLYKKDIQTQRYIIDKGIYKGDKSYFLGCRTHRDIMQYTAWRQGHGGTAKHIGSSMFQCLYRSYMRNGIAHRSFLWKLNYKIYMFPLGNLWYTCWLHHRICSPLSKWGSWWMSSCKFYKALSKSSIFCPQRSSHSRCRWMYLKCRCGWRGRILRCIQYSNQLNSRWNRKKDRPRMYCWSINWRRFHKNMLHIYCQGWGSLSGRWGNGTEIGKFHKETCTESMLKWSISYNIGRGWRRLRSSLYSTGFRIENTHTHTWCNSRLFQNRKGKVRGKPRRIVRFHYSRWTHTQKDIELDIHPHWGCKVQCRTNIRWKKCSPGMGRCIYGTLRKKSSGNQGTLKGRLHCAGYTGTGICCTHFHRTKGSILQSLKKRRWWIDTSRMKMMYH